MIQPDCKHSVAEKNKLNWLAPCIQEMDANQTEGKTFEVPFEFFVNGTQGHGPSWIPNSPITENNQKRLEWIAPQILEMSTALTYGKSYGGIEASPLEPPGPS